MGKHMRYINKITTWATVLKGNFGGAAPKFLIRGDGWIMKKFKNQSGFSLIEILIATVLAGLISAAAFSLFDRVAKQWDVQSMVSDTQHNCRAGLADIIGNVRKAGAFLPESINSIAASNTDPDSITILYSGTECNFPLGRNSNKQGNPVHVSRDADLSCFSVGQSVCLYRPSTGASEWFSITNISDNQGNGWQEIHHQGQALEKDPQIGDIVLNLQSIQYYLDYSDSAHPVLMKVVDGSAPQIYSEDVEDLQFIYTLSDNSTTSSPTANDTVRVVDISIRARTAKSDEEYVDAEGYRKRELNTRVYIRN
ncbi:MAG: type II secretion system protein [candidate division Zixibacteria bacterium]|nr:type II secretion system protein [candidate division Zixibacteria bacterium]